MSEDGLTQTATETTEDGRHPADRIADFLEEHGWIQEEFKSDEGFCVVGAGTEIFGLFDFFNPENITAVIERVQTTTGTLIRSLTEWNDIPGRTKEEVLRALRGQK